ncbi:MAG: DNA repair protein RecO [Bacteroidota bacterium]|nr:DNA repair protein RecO [Bacteroidota bacterium]MDP4211602.1 DNA repair protein RecO [Bacteroidota bacterium]MDP4249091.1 DNA repair protein RecO [Bacteroidota bacterium]
MLHKTKGIVLRTVKYAETSIIVSIFTEMFGLQSYLVNGVRTNSRKGSSKTGFFQPAAILDLVVYHHEPKNLERIKEYQWGHLYQHIFFDVVTNAVALFMIELLQKCIKQPESNPELYQFSEDALIHLDRASTTVQANFPLYFALHAASFFGLQISDNYTLQKSYLDLQEGIFTEEKPAHPHFLGNPYSEITSQLLKVMQPAELTQVPLNKEKRRILLQAYLDFYSIHMTGFGSMKTLAVLRTILDDSPS